MKKLVFTYGIIGGLVVASMLIITTTINHQSSNIEGGAIGYFNAYTTDTMSIIIPQ